VTLSDGPEAPRLHRFPLLDPLRGLAAISVLLVHTGIFSDALDDPGYGRLLAHLDIGVPFFFLLSAFLLYRPFVEARIAGTERTSFTDYGKRRFVRIAPAYWAVLTIAAIVPGMAGAFSGNWWVYYGLLQNYPVYEPTGTCAVNPFRCGVPIAWTLSIEVFFYLTLPLFVLAMAWLGARWRRGWLRLELVVVALLTAISIVIQSSTPKGDLHTWLYFSPLGRGWWFGLGLALAAISVEASRRPREPAFVKWLRRNPGLPVLGGVLLYVATSVVVVPAPSMAFPIVAISSYVAQYLLFGVIAALILLPAIFGADGGGLVRRALRHRTLIWLGLVSYGIFLWQFPVLIFLIDAGVEGFVPLTVLTFGLTVACAAVSFYLLERPLMRRVRPNPAVAGAPTT
jgi:peptidoglycan/LPS O-acetylase OafA/YrhL